MISLRYHIVSIAAAFLALAIGVVLGSTALSGSLLAGLADERSQLADRVSELQAQNSGLQAQLSDSGAVVAAASDDVVAGLLDKRSVVLVTTEDTRQVNQDAMVRLIEQSGAKVTGEVHLTKGFTEPSRAAQLRDLAIRLQPAGVQFPTASDPGALAGALLGSVLLLDGETAERQSTRQELTAALSGMANGGFITHSNDIAPAQLAVVLSGGPATGDDAGNEAARLARFATQLDRSGAGTVLAGTHGSAKGTGAVGVVRANTAATSVLSTVDNADSAAGRLATVLALREQLEGAAGQYGFAGSAKAPLPGMRGNGS